jgi:hypothetical protein
MAQVAHQVSKCLGGHGIVERIERIDARTGVLGGGVIRIHG